MYKIKMYLFFVLMSILLNTSIQHFIFTIFGRNKDIILMSMIVSIAIIFLFKYYVDKKYVFKYETTKKVDKKSFSLYFIFSILTTIIFFITEASFSLFLDIDNKEELGAITGLIIGYILKYILDNKITFKKEEL